MPLTKKALIIFTRYPEVGKTKTRLIPAIGAEKAADLQRKMTELTVKTANDLKAKLDVNIYVYFIGGNHDLMQLWLGENLSFKTQVEGDLGLKMSSALGDSFTVGNQETIIIGIDCPSLNVDILLTAFQQLKNHDLVIGEAEDGGYYLIGLNYSIPELFINIDWGTSQVFRQTIDIAQNLNLQVYNLPILRDIDTPEDLQFYSFN